MAGNQYTITIFNQSGIPQRFVLFHDMPKPANGPSGEVFTHVYQTSHMVESNDSSSMTFIMRDQYFAIYGTSTQGDGGVCVQTNASLPLRLGPGGSVACFTTVGQNGQEPAWDNSAMEGKTFAERGGFSIVTDASFLSPNTCKIIYLSANRLPSRPLTDVFSLVNTYIGCGAADPRGGSVIPIQSFLAEPGVECQIFPKARYFVSLGYSQPGMIVDRNTLGQVLQVDFTGCSTGKAQFTLNADESYDADPSVGANGVTWEFSPVFDA